MTGLFTFLLKTLGSVLDSVLKDQCVALYQSLNIILRYTMKIISSVSVLGCTSYTLEQLLIYTI